jgi:hypothetical protein
MMGKYKIFKIISFGNKAQGVGNRIARFGKIFSALVLGSQTV